jgi:hypothetical protein
MSHFAPAWLSASRTSPPRRRSAKRVYELHDLNWSGDQLCIGHRVLATITPDPEWPDRWRVRSSDGACRDMTNHDQARQAAVSLALAMLNRRHR